ncbi:MAG TPA: hypothetical protein VGF99_08040 [Myxococcota bacterium]
MTREPTAHDRRRHRGYSLPFVLLVLILLSIALASLLFVLLTGARSTESMVGRRRLFYACDGVSRIAAVSAQNYFGQTTTPTSEELRSFVCGEGGGCSDDTMLPTFMAQTPGYQVDAFELSQVGEREIGPLDSGPFEGMNAMKDGVDMRVALKKSSSAWKCDVTQELSLAKIAMFQFFIFSDQPYTDWVPGPDMVGDGRVHANGHLCFYSLGNDLWVERVTAAGRVSSGKDRETSTCRSPSYSDGSARRAPKIATVNAPVFDTNPGNTNPIEANSAHFASFDVRSTTTSTWLTASQAFNGHLQDEAHRVVQLRLPVLGNPPIQRGANADLTEFTNGTTRLLVDPMRLDGSDDDDVRDQRFAFKADIRIVNGVWYVRNPTTPEQIGTAIWSDHPADVRTTADQNVVPGNVAVGQNAIFGATPVPQRFSYYRFNASNQLTTTSLTPAAVVSYGVLARDGATAPIWRPGHVCNSTTVKAVSDPCGSEAFGERLLDGTRAGFRDGHAQNQLGTSSLRANVLPMNIDVAALQNALADCSGRELGSYFPGTCSGTPPTGAVGEPRRFNGIVYITSVWPEAMKMPTPQSMPSQGRRGAGGTTLDEQPVLPEPLCSTTALNGQVINGAGGGALTNTWRQCNDYVAGTYPASDTAISGARPTVVRLYNLRNLNRSHTVNRPPLDRDDVLINGAGKDGLTIASNLPIYTLGDVNRASIPGTEPPTVPAPHWVPFLVAGDVVTILSNSWNDQAALWTSNLGSTRSASETFVNMEMLAGWTPTTTTAYSGGLHNFPRFLESWSGIDLHIRGSLVVGWAAVYARWKRHCCNNTSYQAPDRDWGFDKTLRSILKQPPGAPLFDVQSTRRWKR